MSRKIREFKSEGKKIKIEFANERVNLNLRL